MSSSTPSVSVLVLNFNGRRHLEKCLASLEQQAYPSAEFEVVVVDNGSTDDSLEFVKRRYPRVRTLSFDRNRGFCLPYNTAVRSCEGDFVALLNNDTRVDPRWLAELISAAQRHHATAAASQIVDWTGERIDFAGGVMSFIGHSWQSDFRQQATRTYEERQLLFACGGSMLVNRAAFLEAGGFDEDFFAYFEDVDLGWRLNLLGHTVVLAPRALTYHRLHGTTSRWAYAQRLRLFERNALAMIFKNYEAATLQKVLPAAVALSLLRGLTRSGIDTLPLDLASQSPPSVGVTQNLIAHLIALEDFCRQLPALKRKRELVQSRRRHSDAELFELFGDPFRLHEDGGIYEDVARILIRDFGIDKIFEKVPVATSPTVTVGGRELSKNSTAPTRSLTAISPTVSIVILTALGATHLPECLTSLRRQTYASDRVEVIVVDNASTDDPTAVVQSYYPGARVIRNATNIGFAAGNNAGAAVANGDYLVFLNDDTRVDPNWLFELVGTAERRGAAAVASCILDWSGNRIDFAEGAVNFQGKGFQFYYDAPVDTVCLEEKRLLFACGCAMLIDRAVFFEAGNWDDGAFAYYEDVELGWRLNLLGYEVWFAPEAVVYHKHHGTSGRWPEPPRIRLYERNSLRMLYRLLETRSLERVLPAAMLLATDRALLSSRLSRVASGTERFTVRHFVNSAKAQLRARGINRRTPIGKAVKRLWIHGFLRLARDLLVATSWSGRAAYLIEEGSVSSVVDTQFEMIPIEAAAMLAGIYGFLKDLPNLTHDRADLQARRRVTDSTVLSRFGTGWLSESPAAFQAEHNALHKALIDEFELAAIGALARRESSEAAATAAHDLAVTE